MKGELNIDGKIYVSARRLAAKEGYSSDHLSRLARGGKVDGKLVGRSWFVNEESLNNYTDNQHPKTSVQPSASPNTEETKSAQPIAITDERKEAMSAGRQPVVANKLEATKQENKEARKQIGGEAAEHFDSAQGKQENKEHTNLATSKLTPKTYPTPTTSLDEWDAKILGEAVEARKKESKEAKKQETQKQVTQKQVTQKQENQKSSDLSRLWAQKIRPVFDSPNFFESPIFEKQKITNTKEPSHYKSNVHVNIPLNIPLTSPASRKVLAGVVAVALFAGGIFAFSDSAFAHKALGSAQRVFETMGTAVASLNANFAQTLRGVNSNITEIFSNTADVVSERTRGMLSVSGTISEKVFEETNGVSSIAADGTKKIKEGIGRATGNITSGTENTLGSGYRNMREIFAFVFEQTENVFNTVTKEIRKAKDSIAAIPTKSAETVASFVGASSNAIVSTSDDVFAYATKVVQKQVTQKSSGIQKQVTQKSSDVQKQVVSREPAGEKGPNFFESPVFESPPTVFAFLLSPTKSAKNFVSKITSAAQGGIANAIDFPKRVARGIYQNTKITTDTMKTSAQETARETQETLATLFVINKETRKQENKKITGQENGEERDWLIKKILNTGDAIAALPSFLSAGAVNGFISLTDFAITRPLASVAEFSRLPGRLSRTLGAPTKTLVASLSSIPTNFAEGLYKNINAATSIIKEASSDIASGTKDTFVSLFAPTAEQTPSESIELTSAEVEIEGSFTTQINQENSDTELAELRRELDQLKQAGIASETPVAPTIIERTVEQVVSGITQIDLTNQLNVVENELRKEIAKVQSTGVTKRSSLTRTLALATKIDRLDGVDISDATIDGSTSFSGTTGTFSGNVTAQSNLTISGTLDTTGATTLTSLTTTGNTTVQGNLTVSGTQIFNGALTASYLSATSTDTASTIDYRLGIATSSPYRALSVSGNSVFDATLITFASSSATTALDLDFPGTATTTVTLTNGLNFDSNTFVIDPNSNNVGIGTAAPAKSLHVNSGTLNIVSLFESTDALGGISLMDGGTTDNGQVLLLASSNNLLLYSGGNERIRLLSSGNLGIGTTNPGNPLSVAGAADINGVLSVSSFSATSTTATSTIEGGLAIETSGFVYDYSSGNVGIGTAAPANKLTIDNGVGSGSISAVDVTSTGTTIFTVTGGSSSGFPLYQLIDQEAGGATWNIENGREGDGTLGFFLGGSDSKMVINSSGNVGIGTTNPGNPLSVAGAVDINGVLSVPTFAATSTSATSTIKGGLAIETSGFVYDYSTNRVGIGTAAPATKLHVQGGRIRIQESDGTGKAGVLELANGSKTNYIFTGGSVDPVANALYLYTASSDDLLLQAGGGTTGNVGIGNITPSTLLDVAGDISLSGGDINIGTGSATTTISGNGTGIGIGMATPVAPLTFANAAVDKISLWDGTNDRYGFGIGSGELQIYAGAASAANHISFGKYDETTFTEWARIQNGNVGIGTAAPGNPLSVAGAADINGVLSVSSFSATSTSATSTIEGGLAIETSGFVYDYSTNNVGIGTASPGATLEVNGNIFIEGENSLDSSITSAQIFENSTNDLTLGAARQIYFISDSNNNGTTDDILFQKVDTSSDNNLMIIRQSGNVGIGTIIPDNLLSVAGAADINGVLSVPSFSATSTTATSTISGGLAIETSGFVYDYSSGNVGIGTAAPGVLLDVLGTGDVIVKIKSSSASNSRSASVDFYGDNDNAASLIGQAGNAGRLLTTAAAGDLVIGNRTGANIVLSADSSFAAQQLVITELGSVGIGTTNPGNPLSVAGAADINGVLSVPSFSATSTTATSTISGGLAIETSGFVYDYSTNRVGIGTAAPVNNLVVTGSGNINSLVDSTAGRANIIINSAANKFARAIFKQNNVTADEFDIGLSEDGTGNFYIAQGSSMTTKYVTVQKDTGQVGIGTTNPGNPLSVAGAADINGVLSVPSFSATSTTATSTIEGGLAIETSGFVYDYSSGNVGIGTAAPIEELDIHGTGDVKLLVSSDSSSGVRSALIKFIGESGGSDSIVGQAGGAGRIMTGSLAGEFIIINRTGSNLVFSADVGNSEKQLVITEPGNVGIATTSPWRAFSVNGTVGFENLTSATTGNYLCQDTTTNEVTSGTSCSLSSVRYKENIENIGYGLSSVLALRPIEFDYKPKFNIPGHQVGFIAEEVFSVVPEVVTYDKNGNPGGIDYAKLTAVLAKGLQDIVGVIDLSSAPTSTPSMVIDANGNIGIGTTSPEYDLHVLGDVAAESFVNISTAGSKKDISHLGESERASLLQTLADVNIATYRYKDEADDAPLRLGLIAEEAPKEILAKGGKGIDLYKLATFNLAVTQELKGKLSGLETRVESLEALAGAGSGGVSVDGVLAYFTENFVRIKNLAVATFTVGTSEKPSGITLYDEATGEPYCLKIRNGQTVTEPGVCQTQNTNTQSPNGTDTTPPTITILGSNPAELALNASYSDNGATVTDNVDTNLGYQTYLDGVLVSQIQIDTGTTTTYTIDYVATDTAGNTATSTRTVIIGPNTQTNNQQPTTNGDTGTASSTPVVADTTAPVIALIGESTVVVTQNETYTDSGATASDDTDGDITTNMITDNPVDTATVGTYTVRYNVTDTAGNTATEVTRSVTVVEAVTPQPTANPTPTTTDASTSGTASTTPQT